MKLGYIGLGKMGKGMVTLLTEKGHELVTYDPNEESSMTSSIEELVSKLDDEKLVWIMAPHNAVDDILEELTPLLNEGDTIIDGGNSYYKNSVRRGKELKEKGINFMDAGVSGGPSGARNGACTMIGSTKETFEKYEELFKDMSADGAYQHTGPIGAGHYVKMVHNGIEYGMMQAIGEGFEIMKKAPFDINLTNVTKIYNTGSVIESRLTGWLLKAFEEYGEDLNEISGEVSHTGEGEWTVKEAVEVGVPAPIIEGSFKFRVDSTGNPSYTGQVVSALRNQFGGHNVKKT